MLAAEGPEAFTFTTSRNHAGQSMVDSLATLRLSAKSVTPLPLNNNGLH